MCVSAELSRPGQICSSWRINWPGPSARGEPRSGRNRATGLWRSPWRTSPTRTRSRGPSSGGSGRRSGHGAFSASAARCGSAPSRAGALRTRSEEAASNGAGAGLLAIGDGVLAVPRGSWLTLRPCLRHCTALLNGCNALDKPSFFGPSTAIPQGSPPRPFWLIALTAALVCPLSPSARLPTPTHPGHPRHKRRTVCTAAAASHTDLVAPFARAATHSCALLLPWLRAYYYSTRSRRALAHC